MPNAIKKRLSVHQDWFGDIPLKNLWGINFSARTSTGNMFHVGDSISEVLDTYSPGTYQTDVDLFDRVTDSEVGFLLAQSVAMPTESFETSTVGQKSAGGFLQGLVGGDRSAPAKLSVGFLETNIDVFSFFIKPWMVAASFKGLIEDDEDDIKCNIDIFQYSRSDKRYRDKVKSSQDTDRSRVTDYTLRKMTSFYDCVPTNMVEDRFSYGELGQDELIREVDFIYSHYRINTPRRS